MIIFGAQHFMYAAFIATLIPAWIPFHLFWVYFTGTGFIIAGLSIASGVLARLAALGLSQPALASLLARQRLPDLLR